MLHNIEAVAKQTDSATNTKKKANVSLGVGGVVVGIGEPALEPVKFGLCEWFAFIVLLRNKIVFEFLIDLIATIYWKVMNMPS